MQSEDKKINFKEIHEYQLGFRFICHGPLWYIYKEYTFINMHIRIKLSFMCKNTESANTENTNFFHHNNVLNLDLQKSNANQLMYNPHF